VVETAVVVSAGVAEPEAWALVDSDALDGAFVVAADAGADGALSRGLRVDLAIGDFDSISAAGLAELERVGTRIERHARAKAATDLELALDAAIAVAPRRILVIGSAGGRLDHLLSSLDLLASARYASVELDAVFGGARVHVINSSRALIGSPGELVSLHALHGTARRVFTEGLVYPLAGANLEPGSSRGISNVFANAEARVSVEQGVLLAIRPAAEQ
jgi:thiamine pyrophosphokinase